MEKQEIRTFGRRHGKKLSARKTNLIASVLPTLAPSNTELTSGDAILEIGFGAGEHVRDVSRANPGTIIIGAEPFMNGVAALLGAMCDEGTNEILPEYQNIRIHPDDVRQILGDTDSKFKQIWILHPDPWPKARHEKRRLLQTEFLKNLSAHLAPNGEIIIGTDHWEYFDWIVVRAAMADLDITIPEIEIIQTRYQNKNMADTAMPKYLVLRNH